MLEKWLHVDTTASWSKLFTVIESPAVSCSAPDKGDYSFVYTFIYALRSMVVRVNDYVSTVLFSLWLYSILTFKLHNLLYYPIVNTTPLLKDLQRYITPQYATRWKVIGTQLGLPTEKLNIIERDHMFRAEPCCNAMLEKWLKVDTTASWSKLFTVIESPAVSCSAPDKGNYIALCNCTFW